MPGPNDPRIRVVRYDPNEVIELEGTLGYAMSVEFSENEKIENVAIGDSQAWQVTPNRRANLLFVKPMRRDAVTNMAVYTNLRRYMFDLSVGPDQGARDRNIIFGVRFDYPEPARAVVAADQGPPKPQMPSDVNHAYSYEGSSKNLPTRVFDDGHSTYFTFSAAVRLSRDLRGRFRQSGIRGECGEPRRLSHRRSRGACLRPAPRPGNDQDHQ